MCSYSLLKAVALCWLTTSSYTTPSDTEDYNNSGESSEFYTNKLSRHMEWKTKNHNH